MLQLPNRVLIYELEVGTEFLMQIFSEMRGLASDEPYHSTRTIFVKFLHLFTFHVNLLWLCELEMTKDVGEDGCTEKGGGDGSG